jgi:hypothetical protein
MKEFKEWCKDKVIAFTEGHKSWDITYDWFVEDVDMYTTGINGVQNQYYPSKQVEILWMLKSEYDKLEFPKDYIGKWNKIPEEFEKYCYLFNEKTRIR